MLELLPRSVRVPLLYSVVFFAAALLLAAPAAAQDAGSAKAFLESAFRLYRNGGKGVPLDSSRYYHSSLIELMNTDEKAVKDKGTDIPYARGADSFCNCQEWEGFWVSKLDVSVHTPQRAEALVSFSVYAPKNRRKDDIRTYKYILVSERGQWRIYDVLYLSDPDPIKSVRKALEEEIATRLREQP